MEKLKIKFDKLYKHYEGNLYKVVSYCYPKNYEQFIDEDKREVILENIESGFWRNFKIDTFFKVVLYKRNTVRRFVEIGVIK